MHEFEYTAPASINEAMALFAEHGGNARILAGGTDLIVKMRAGALTPGLVVDGKHIPELNQVKLDNNGLTVGAAVTCRNLYENAEVATAYPALVDSTSLIGGVQIQGRASVGGNLCNAAPSADIIPTLMVLEAVADICSSHSSRQLAVEEFCTGPGRTALAQGEILVSLRIPRLAARSGAAFLRFTPRNEMDIAVANAAAAVVLNESGDEFVSGRIAIGAVGPTPIFVAEAGAFLAGKPVDAATIQAVADMAAAAARPINDMRGTIEQRKHLVMVLTKRALNKAIERARGTD